MSDHLSLMTGPLEAEDDFNLTIVRTNRSILLGRKVRGFGMGQLVVPGGKTRYYIGEAGIALIPFNAEAAREASEETGLQIAGTELVQKGILHIADEEDTKTVRLYEAVMPSATTVTSGELEDLAWRSLDELPYKEMPDDYKFWLPHLLAGYAINAFIESDMGQIVEVKTFKQKLEPLGRMEEVPVELT